MQRLRSGTPLIFPPARSTRTDGTQEYLREMFAAYGRGDNRTAAECFDRLMAAIHKDERVGSDRKTIHEWARLVDAALGVIVQPDFLFPDDMGLRIMRHNPLIANVLGGIGETTDARIAEVDGQEQEAFKSTLLVSPRNESQVDFGMLLDANPLMASQWLYSTIRTMYVGNASPKTHAQMIDILRGVDSRILALSDCHEAYFLCSYFGDIEAEKRVKGAINAAIQRDVSITIRNKPNPRKIAVFAEHWNTGHSVHRTLAAYVRALRPHFDEITLIHTIKETKELDTTGFDRVIRLETKGIAINQDPLQDNEWSALIFAEVGMSAPSVLLANMRIAPVQMLLTGHPVSTFGGVMDWFVTGAKVDTNSNNYSERLAVLPGYGAIHERPKIERKWTPRPPDDEVWIASPAYGQKIHHDWLAAMREAIEASDRKVRVRIFCGNAVVTAKGGAVMMQNIAEALPGCGVELITHQDYETYMRKLAECDFAVDNWPWGGSNAMSDCLWAGLPVIARKSNRWFGNIGPAMVNDLDNYYLTPGRSEFVEAVRLTIKSSGDRNHLRGGQHPNIDRIYDDSDAPIFAQFVADVARDPGYYPGIGPVILGGVK